LIYPFLRILNENKGKANKDADSLKINEILRTVQVPSIINSISIQESGLPKA
jgi:hypothetical protein